jgi:hypothetical protein
MLKKMTLTQRIISQRKNAIGTICRYYGERYLPEVVLVPTARFGFQVVGRLFFSPNDRIVVSPITCRTVIYALMAAGLLPVFVDIDLSNGNIDVAKLSKAVLREAKGIITTNLYGNPDNALEIKKMAKKYDLLMIEDCAHVLNSSIDGQEIGTIGDVSIFSFKKFFDEPGGIVCTPDKDMGGKIRDMVLKGSFQPSREKEVRRFIQYNLPKGIPRPIQEFASFWLNGVRNLKSSQNIDSAAAVPGPFANPVDGLCASNQNYRQFSTTDSLLRVERTILDINRFISIKLQQNRDLMKSCPLESKMSLFAHEVCHFLVPFFSNKRDQIVMKMKEGGVMTWFLYNPPMNELFGKRITNIYPINRDLVKEWSRKILPIDSRYKDKYLKVIQETENPD